MLRRSASSVVPKPSDFNLRTVEPCCNLIAWIFYCDWGGGRLTPRGLPLDEASRGECCPMTPRLTVQASTIIVLLLAFAAARWPEFGFGLTTAATAQDARPTGRFGRPIDNISVARPVWRRGSGLLYGAITLRNANPYPVWNVIIACDFFDEWGNPIGTRATVLNRIFGPGRTRVGGIYFSARTPNTLAGACRPVSAQPYLTSSPIS
jgi:hypothetical protein